MRRLTIGVGVIVLLALALAGRGPVLAQGGPDIFEVYGPALLPAFQADLDPLYRTFYDMSVTLSVDDEAARFRGTVAVQVSNTSEDAWESVVFRLYPNLESYGGQMTVENVTVEGAPVTPRLDSTETILEIPLPEAAAPGETFHLSLDFETTLTAGVEALYNQFSYLDGVLAAPDFYPILSVYEPDEGGWWRETVHSGGDAIYAETSHYRVRLTAPEDFVLATSGVTREQTPGDDGTVTYEIIAPLMREFALMGSADFQVESATVGGVTVNAYSYEENAAYRRAGLNLAVDSLAVFNQAFGLYPFAEMDIVETPTAAGGIEYPGLVVIAERLWSRVNQRFMWVVVHEVAHQWWFSLVGNDQTRDPWLDEALAQYGVIQFFGDMIGPNGRQSVISYFDQTFSPLRGTIMDQPIGLPVAEYGNSDVYVAIVYNKGPLFFVMLEQLIGQDVMLEALRDYFTAYRYEVAEPADLLDSFERTLDRDLDDIFRNWVGEFPGLD